MKQIMFNGVRIPYTSNYELVTTRRKTDALDAILLGVKMRVTVHDCPGETYTIIQGICTSTGTKVFMWSDGDEFSMSVTAVKKMRSRMDRKIVADTMLEKTNQQEKRLKNLEKFNAYGKLK